MNKLAACAYNTGKMDKFLIPSVGQTVQINSTSGGGGGVKELCTKSCEMGEKEYNTKREVSIAKQDEQTCQRPVSTVTDSARDLSECLHGSKENREHFNDPTHNTLDQKVSVENGTCTNQQRKRKKLSQSTLNIKKVKLKEDNPDETFNLSILMKPSRDLRGENFHCDYFSHFMPRSEADKLLSDCEGSLTYFTGELATVKLYGRSIPIPRKQVAYGDDGLTYTYSGITVPARPWLPFLAAVRQRIEEKTGFKFNFVLINRYKDGQDSMGEHRDDEKDLDLHHPIASLSLGQHRDFIFRHKDARGKNKTRDIDPIKLELEHGSLLMMNPPTNDFWYHSLPRRANQTGVRINMTFRKILRLAQMK